MDRYLYHFLKPALNFRARPNYISGAATPKEERPLTEPMRPWRVSGRVFSTIGLGRRGHDDAPKVPECQRPDWWPSPCFRAVVQEPEEISKWA